MPELVLEGGYSMVSLCLMFLRGRSLGLDSS
jgi:hypothetical protein